MIPAASAIAGRVSASQELPYMTPPIVQSQQYFSGDSQDSSSMLKTKKNMKFSIFLPKNVLIQSYEFIWLNLQKDTQV